MGNKRVRVPLPRRAATQWVLALLALAVPLGTMWSFHSSSSFGSSPALERQQAESRHGRASTQGMHWARDSADDPPSAFVARSNREVSGDEEIPPTEAATEGTPNEDFLFNASRLLKMWQGMYGLEDTLPPQQVVLSPPAAPGVQGVPWAPHLEECVAVEHLKEGMEVAEGQGELPA